MTIRSTIIIALALLLQHAQASEAKVLIIGIDGLRPDAIAAAHPLPAFDALKAQSAWSDNAHNVLPTISGPNWASILCGVRPDRHRVVNNNFDNHHLDRFPSMLNRLATAKPGLRTASIVAWAPINKHINLAPAVKMTKEHPSSQIGDDAVANDAAQLIRDGQTDVIFLQFDTIDDAGHEHGYGPASPQYLEALHHMDARVGLVTKAIEERRHQHAEDWLVVAVTDHGGKGHGHGGDSPEEATVFLWISGGRIAPGPVATPPHTVDIAPTVAAHLGVAVDPSWGWEGHAFALAGAR